MKKETGNPNFEYELSCDQMCGNGHYSMKGVVKVVTQEEFDAWKVKQKPAYFASFPAKEPLLQGGSVADTTKAKDTTKAIAKSN